ncbi:MAG TPA: efflux RND transporter periplasmic adaptor subunit, partial [Terriglobales bacterium]|nr:efflux RND transporter periplasmic adaptor subunit [Terriglobales bacterium]
DSGAVAGNDLQIARQAVAAAKAEVASRRAVEEAARHALAAQSTLEEYLHVRAPFAGMVTRRSVAEGALAGPGGAALFELAQSDPLRLVADVPEAETPGMHEGERMPFTVISRPGETFYGVLARPAHSLRRDSRTMPVEFDVANPHGDLVPGMFVQLKWSFQRDAAASMVPVTAVVRTAERTFVETLDGQQHVRWVDVTTGFSTGKEIEIFGPVELGSNVIVNASDEIHPGDTVNVVARPS